VSPGNTVHPPRSVGVLPGTKTAQLEHFLSPSGESLYFALIRICFVLGSVGDDRDHGQSQATDSEHLATGRIHVGTLLKCDAPSGATTNLPRRRIFVRLLRATAAPRLRRWRRPRPQQGSALSGWKRQRRCPPRGTPARPASYRIQFCPSRCRPEYRHARLPFPHHHPRPQHGRRPRPVARHRYEGRRLRQADRPPSSIPSLSSCRVTSISRISANWWRARSRRPAASPRNSTRSPSMTASPWATAACSIRCRRAN